MGPFDLGVRGSVVLGDAKPGAIKVWLLGGFRVSVGSRVIEQDDWHLRKAAALVKLLALSPGHRLHREQIMDLLWPELGTKAASNNLRQVLYAARRILDPAVGSRYLASREGSLALCPGGDIWVDADVFEVAAQTARRVGEPSAYEAALDLYAGDLLPEDRYEGWADGRRRELRGAYLSLLFGLASAHEKRGDHGSAVEALLRAVSEDPVREDAHVGLMRLYALSGRKAEALRQYDELQNTVSRELGVEPSASSRALREEIATGRFSLPGQPVAVPLEAPYATPRHTVPIQRTSFVGRESELVDIRGDLAMTRLLTLTGAGGTGKTRLALELAGDLAGAYQDGAWLVELAPLSEPDLVIQRVARSLGVREQPGLQLENTLLGVLREKELLIVLDNCEHLIDAAARLADALVDACPRVRILATSREPLRVPGETIRLLSPLSVPDSSEDAAGIARHGAVRLFVERVRLRLPAFEITPQNRQAIVDLCRKLDGIPLALELAAARAGTLAMEQVAQRLEDSLTFLNTGPRTVAPRQRSLRASLEWSHGLLGEPERKLFARLSVFAGGFTLEAAEAVCPGDGIREEGVLGLLSNLVDKSLVVAETTAAGGVRYRMLEPVRQYASVKLDDSTEAEAVRYRHAAFFLELAERAVPELKGPGQVEWLQRLEGDNDNLRVAMAWLLERGEVETVVRMAWALWIFWLIHAHMDEGRRWIEAALAKGENLTGQQRAQALWVQASTYYGKGTPEQIERMCEEAATLFRQAGDKYGLGHVVAGSASAAMQQGDARRATSLFKESLELARDVGDKWAQSSVLGHVGSMYLAQGNYEEAMRYFEEGLALSNEIGNKLSVSLTLYNMALAAQGQGDYERARELYAEGLRSSSTTDDKANTAYCLEGLAQVAAEYEETERAARLFGAAEAALDAAGGAVYVYAQSRSLHEQAVAGVRSRLHEAVFSSAWAEGSAMPLGEAIEYALYGERPAPRASHPVARQPPAGRRPVVLTRREQEVAALVGRGLTNRQIASELTISEHTVANHVAKILRKLRLRSRSQIGTWMGQQQTLP